METDSGRCDRKIKQHAQILRYQPVANPARYQPATNPSSTLYQPSPTQHQHQHDPLPTHYQHNANATHCRPIGARIVFNNSPPKALQVKVGIAKATALHLAVASGKIGLARDPACFAPHPTTHHATATTYPAQPHAVPLARPTPPPTPTTPTQQPSHNRHRFILTLSHPIIR